LASEFLKGSLRSAQRFPGEIKGLAVIGAKIEIAKRKRVISFFDNILNAE
jgi:hypothetical protein